MSRTALPAADYTLPSASSASDPIGPAEAPTRDALHPRVRQIPRPRANRSPGASRRSSVTSLIPPNHCAIVFQTTPAVGMTVPLPEADLRRQLLDSMQRYGKEFRRRNPEVKQEVESVCSSIRSADKIDADLMRKVQIVQLLIYGCYTKQPVIVSASLQVCDLLASQDLLMDYDRQLLAQLLTEMSNSSLQVPEIGTTALACALTPDRLSGVYLGKAIGVCLRQNCDLADLHRLAALVIDRVSPCPVADSVEDKAPPLSSLASPTRKTPPKDPATADAFALLRDLCSLSDHNHSDPPCWLHGVSEVSSLVVFDVISYVLHNRAPMLLDDALLEELLCQKIFPAVSAGLKKAGMQDYESSYGDDLFLRLCLLAHLLLRNYRAISRLQEPCAEVLRSLLHCLPSVGTNRRCMVLQAWASLLTRIRGPTVKLFFTSYLPDTVEWLCATLQKTCEQIEELPSAQSPTEHSPGAYVAFRTIKEITLKEAQLAIDLEWFSSKQRTTFSHSEERFLLLASLRALVVSLNAVLAQLEENQMECLTALIDATCKAATGSLAALVWSCVHRPTEQALILSLETLFELSGRVGRSDTCKAIMALHHAVANDSLNRLATSVSPELSPAALAAAADRLAQFGISAFRLVSEYAPFVPAGPHGWSAFCNLFCSVVAHFEIPLFSASFEDAAGRAPPETEVRQPDSEVGEFRQELFSEVEAFAAATSRFPLEVLHLLLQAEFEFGQTAEKTDTSRLFFVMAKVTELAVFNLERFHAFALEWLNHYVLLFFVESPYDIPAARHCFALLFDRLVRKLELSAAGVTEEAIVSALHLLESCTAPHLMTLQIVCLERLLGVLNSRTATGIGGNFKTLVALPDLLRRHTQLSHGANIRAVNTVLATFAQSAAITTAPAAMRRQACERGLILGVELMRQETELEVAASAPAAMRHLYCLMNDELNQAVPDSDIEAFLLEHLPELEKFCRDDRASVSAEACGLLFDVFSGSTLLLSNWLFPKLTSEMLFQGFSEFIRNFEDHTNDTKISDKIVAFANYILNSSFCILRRFSNEKHRPYVTINLWCEFFNRLQEASQLSIEPITFAVLSAFSHITAGLSHVEADTDVNAIRNALWPHGMTLASEAAQSNWRVTTEILLPDTVFLLCDLFAVQFPELSNNQRRECADLTVRIIRYRSLPATSHQNVVAKERCLMSLLERIARGLFEEGGRDGKELASHLMAALCDAFFEEVVRCEENTDTTWPKPYHQSYLRLAYNIMSDFTFKVMDTSNASECSTWLQQHMQLCETASRFQYRCSDLYTWRCVHNCVAIALDSLKVAVCICGSDERLADAYEQFLSSHLFTTEKHSRFLSSADFLEHQTMEHELLASMRDFVATPNGSPDAKHDSLLHTRLSRYLVTQLGSKAHIPVTDAVVNIQTAGPAAADEFFDSRHWRFQMACVEALVAIVHSLVKTPRQDGYACSQVFDAYVSYVKTALSSFHDRLEVRSNEPLPAVCYYEVNAIVTTMKDMLEGSQMSNVFIPGVVELYPFFVDLVIILRGRLLSDLLDLLHAYKAFMSIGTSRSSKNPVGRLSVTKSILAVLR